MEWVTNVNTQVSDKIDRTMAEAEQIIADKGLQKKWDDEAKQNYVEYTENGEKHQIWVEDEAYMRQRIDLVKKYGLRGVAAWAVGQEKPSIWYVFGLH
jgi:spore germination protein YaaH